MKYHTQQSGMSLPEVIIAMALFVLLVISCSGLVLSALQLQAENAARLSSMRDAENDLAIIRFRALEDPGSMQDGVFDASCLSAGCPLQSTTTSTARTLTITDLPPYGKAVTIHVPATVRTSSAAVQLKSVIALTSPL